jgi:CheY-like chemotaxis protein
MAPPHPILLVEDFAPFRRFLRLALGPMAKLEIVGEALDGLDAVQKAQELQPALILMDIGLPKLSGIAAAERILAVAPKTKILFISLESSPVVVREAFRVGGHGYLSKLRAQVDLIPAIESVLGGRQFISSDLEFKDDTKARRRHDVLFYSAESVFVDDGSRFVSSALKADAAAIVIATKSHHEALVQQLKEDCDIDGAIQQGTYIPVDVTQALSEIVVNGHLDRGRFLEILGGLIDSSKKATKTEHARVAFLGECVDLLSEQGNTDAVIEIEKICNDLMGTYDIDVLCAYAMRAFREPEQVFQRICAQHSAVFSR